MQITLAKPMAGETLSAPPACELCLEPATDQCSGCKKAVYCGRKCQVTHWPAHREACRAAAAREIFYQNWVNAAHSRIAGNVLIMAAYGGSVRAVIDETISEFTTGGSMHVAHLSLAHVGSEPTLGLGGPTLGLTEPTLGLGGPTLGLGGPTLGLTGPTCTYVFKNYSRIISLAGHDLHAIADRNPAPEALWSVVFDM